MYSTSTSITLFRILCLALLARTALSRCPERVFNKVSCSPTCAPLDCEGSACHSRSPNSFPYAQVAICANQGLSCPNPASGISEDVCAFDSVTRASLSSSGNDKVEFNVTFYARFDLELLALIDTGSAPRLSGAVSRLAVFRAISRMNKLGRIAAAQFGSVADFGLRSLRVLRQPSITAPKASALAISRGRLRATNPSEVLRALLLASTNALVQWTARRRVIVLVYENSSPKNSCDEYFSGEDVVQVLRQTGTSVVWLTNRDKVNDCISQVVRETNGEIISSTDVQQITKAVQKVSRRSVGGRSEAPGSVVRLQNTKVAFPPNVGPRTECGHQTDFNSSRGLRFVLQDPQVRESFQVRSNLACRTDGRSVCDVSFSMFDNYVPLHEEGVVRRAFVQLDPCAASN